MSILKPFQLLEINIISAQDLEPVSKKMKTYAVAWVNRHRKLSSRVDSEGNTNPTWNDKFVFRVDEEFLRQDTSAVMIEIYAARWFRNTLVGTVRILVGNLIPPPAHPHSRHRQRYGGMRFCCTSGTSTIGTTAGNIEYWCGLTGQFYEEHAIVHTT
ncbi:Calcium-dependent lipid-binding (CaLB domain) family protein [Abeliophyllum distichum]|uniref:Calcium-dependent lipid-binding (CaLB domain) family protein n=1 Tax=Abeliophyllum distichum TaxID=126358 RepID=A0ABD1NSU7_9LAMI